MIINDVFLNLNFKVMVVSERMVLKLNSGLNYFGKILLSVFLDVTSLSVLTVITFASECLSE